MRFTLSPHAKACAQVGAPLVAAAAGLACAAIVCREASPRTGEDAAADMAAVAKAGYVAGGDLQAVSAASLPPPAAWPRPAKAKDLDCLSQAVYFEARGESPAGQAAVAQVVLNRARHPAYPKSVCAVVFQPATDGGCQFSFVCDGAMGRPLEPEAWRRARTVAARALQGYVMTAVGHALNFHAAGAAADRQAGTPVARLGHHVFFVAAPHPAPVPQQASHREVAVEAEATAEPAVPPASN